MKKFIALLLAIGMCVSLCSCGGGSNQLVGKWKSATSDTTFELNKGGKAVYGALHDSKWKQNNNTVIVTGKEDNSDKEFNLEIIKFDDVTCLQNNNYIYVLENEYETAVPIIKKNLIEQAQLLDWKKVNSEYLSNRAKASQDYDNKLFRYTATVARIDDYFVDVCEEWHNGLP